MGSQRLAAILVIIGSVLFLAAAFSPISRVFAMDAERKIEAITAAPNQWALSQVLFGLGAFVTAAGVGLLARAFPPGRASSLLWVAAGLLLVGAAFWAWHLWLRTADPVAFAHRDQPFWQFPVYTLFSQLGFALMGIGLLHTGLPPWVGWMLAGSMAVLFVLLLVFRDMPPFAYYLLTLVAGVVFLRTPAPDA